MDKTGLPLTPSVAQRLIFELFSGKTVTRQKIVEGVVKLFGERGGNLEDSSDPTATIKKALSIMKEDGRVSSPQVGYWSIEAEQSEILASDETGDVSETETELDEPRKVIKADKVIGQGRDSVYVYYYPAYRKLAEINAQKIWPCKIGMSERDPVLRVLSQGGTGMPEVPVIALVIRTSQASALEKALHYVLTARGKATDSSRGTEWFITHPEEIETMANWILGE